MSTVQLFSQISLAEAAYANLSALDINSTKQQLISRLVAVDNGFSQSQAEHFANHWRVVHHQPDTLSGFSATLFESIDNPGEYTFAIRGTGDLLQDIVITDITDIVLDGIALDQVVDMYNYWQRLKADESQSYQIARLVELSDLTEQLAEAFLQGQDVGEALAASLGAQPGIIIDLPTLTVRTVIFEQFSEPNGLGLIPDDLSGINVAGHSLGGHLAMAFTRLFEEDNPTTYTANGAGFRIHFNVDNLLNALAQTETSFDDNRIINLYGTAGLNFVTQDVFLGLNQEGIRVPIFTENSLKSGSTLGHGVGQLTDSAVVYDLMIALDASLQALPPLDAISRLTPLFKAASNDADFSVESLVNALGKLLASDFTKITKAQKDNREVLYSSIQTIRQAIFVNPNVPSPVLSPEFQGLTIAPLNALASELKVKALGVSLDDPADAIAYRYALAHLNPFVITGNNALYDLHNPVNANGVGPLDLENFSEDYLQDAADFLALKIELGLADKESKSGGSIFTQVYQKLEDTGAGEKEIELRINNIGPGGSRDRYFIFGGAGNDKLEGDSRADHLYGNDGDDELSGKGGRDILEGNFGNDVLYGGYKVDGVSIDDGVSDILRGGAGFDTYHVGHGDVIQDDAAGEGAIFLPNGTEVSDRTYTLSAGTDNVYVNGDLRLIHVENVITYVTDTVSGLTFNLLGFQPGHFGITLDGAVQTNFTLIEGTDNTDEITGTADADEIRGYLGNDRLFGQAGNDLIDGGEGDNYLDGGDGDDTLTVGSGRNFLGGAGGHDVLTGGAGGNFLQGGFGHDTLQGGAGDDLLVGDAGADVLRGGAGNDLLIGDGGYFTLDTWGFTFIDTTPGEPGGIVVTFAEGVFGGMDSVDDQGDILYGEEGDDVLFGGGGNDQLFGGEDHDSLIGGDGDDYLDGGDGDDYLEGDDRNDLNATGNDTLFGGAGNDILDGGAGDDYLSGGDGNDQLRGGDGDDMLYGDDGDDVIFGQAGDDFADGGAGNDQIDGGDGDDVLFGGAGNDLIRGGTGKDFIDGGDGDDQLFGNEDDDIIHGGAGMDTISGGDGNDSLIGGLDNDVLLGGAGDDELHGDDGDDQLQGGAGNDILRGGTGNDVLFGEAGDDQLFGDAGDDQLIGGIGHDLLDGGDGNDFLWGGEGDDILRGGAGNDHLFGEAGHDHLDGGDGDDILIGGDGNDVLEGGAGQDELQGGEGDDVLSGGAGNDVLFGENGNDSLSGGSGDDILFGGAGFDFLSGGDGNDELQGGNDDDILHGDAGDDRLFGDAGNDVLHGGTGDDLLVGDAGNDVYLFNIGDGRDTIIEQGDTSGDYIILGEGIAPEETYVNRSGNDLVIKHTYDSNDSLTVRNWYLGPANKLDHIEFADGTIWNQATIEANLNLPPVANPDTVSGDEDTDIIISAGTLIANDSDPNGNRLSVVQVSNPVNGTVTLNQEGDVVFTPHPDFSGQAFFDYTVTDNRGGFATQTVTVDVLNVNDAPVANPDIFPVIVNASLGGALVPGAERKLNKSDAVDTFISPATTRLANGNIVTVWQGYPLSGGGTDLAIQMFDESGNKLGGKKQVNIGSTGSNLYPAIAPLVNGGFIVMWQSDASGISVSRNEIAGQLFDTDGNKVGTEFRVNTVTTLFQQYPGIVDLADGGFFAVWSSYYSSVNDFVLAGQRFDGNGIKIGNEINLGISTTDLYKTFDIASFNNGGFVLAADNGLVYRYDSNGTLLGSAVFSNHVEYSGSFGYAVLDITVLSNDQFVVAWANGPELRAQLFSATGQPLGSSFIVDSGFADSTGADISITAREDGGFVIAWLDNAQGNGIVARMYDQFANPAGEQIIINTPNNPGFEFVDLIGLIDGGFMAVWTNMNDPGNNQDDTMETRVFNVANGSNGLSMMLDVLGNDTDIDPDDTPENFTLGSVTLHGERGRVSIVNNKVLFEIDEDFSSLVDGEMVVFTMDYTMSDIGGLNSSSTATIIIKGSNDAPVVVSPLQDLSVDEGTQFDFMISPDTFVDPDVGDSLIYSVTLSDGSALPGWLSFDSSTLTFSGAPTRDDIGEITIKVVATDTAGLAAIDEFILTINKVIHAPVANPDSGELVMLPPLENPQIVTGDETTISTAQPRVDEFGFADYPDATRLANNNIAVVWDTFDLATYTSQGLAIRILDPKGRLINGEVIGNIYPVAMEKSPSIAGLNNGNFVVTWHTLDTSTGDDDSHGIVAQLFDPLGNKLGTEFLVNTNTVGEQRIPTITSLNNGDFVIIWETHHTDIAIVGQLFDSAGNKKGGEFIINSANILTPNLTGSPGYSIDALENSGFIVTWGTSDPSLIGRKALGGVAAQLFDNSGIAVGDRFLVSTDNTISQISSVSSLVGGNFVITYTVNGSLSVAAQLYDSGGNKIGGEFIVNETINDTGFKFGPKIAALEDGGFIITWAADQGGSNALKSIEAQRFDALGNKAGSEFTVSTPQEFVSNLPVVTGLAEGGYLFIWVDSSEVVEKVQIRAYALKDDPINEITLDVLANDTDIDSNPLDFTLDTVTVRDGLGEAFIVESKLLYQPGSALDFLAEGQTTNVIIDYTMSDDTGLSSSSTATIVVTGINDVPVVVNSITAQFTDEDTPFNYTIPKDIIIDPDIGDNLNFVAALSDGSALPAWLAFNPENRTFSGTPLDSDVGTIEIRITATDTFGKSVSTKFQLTVNDVLNLITGDADDNVLIGTDEGDLISGGSGNDTLIGGLGNDIYLFGRGDGNDVIIEADTAQGGDVLRFAEDIAFADVQVSLDRKDLVFTLKESSDSIILQQWKSGKNAYPITVEFGDGTVLTSDDLNVKFNSGGSGNDTVRGSRVNDYLYGLGGNDRILAKDGDDVLDGGAGNDILEGGTGNDTYQFTSGWGNDTIMEDDTTPGNTDIVAFGSGLLPLDLMFTQSGNDLLVSQIGTADTIALRNWYLGNQYQAEIFRASDGSILLNTQVDQLIQAMAGFSAESGLDWASAVQQRPEDVETVLASAWQTAA
jgi:Ca2+-binding RTX toxin-like protein